MRKWLKPLQDPTDYARLAAELADMLALEDQQYLKVFFGDEAGFSLDPSIPYGWQPCGTYQAMVPRKHKRHNVFGLLSRDNTLKTYDITGAMNATSLVACLDDFCTTITQKTVVVLDNAPFHHAKIVSDRLKQWQEKDLYVWFLPKYSPHLNKIETLWRKIKYEWLKPHDYLNPTTFEQALNHIFGTFGTNFAIHFTT